MSDLAARRQLNRGYDDGMARALEIVLTPLVLGAIGFGLDAWLGTRPFLTIALGVLGVVGIFVKLWLGYDREMRVHEADGAWRATPAGGSARADEAPVNPSTVTSWQGVRRPTFRPDASPAQVRPGYVTALAATFRFFRSQVDTRKAQGGEGRVP